LGGTPGQSAKATARQPKARAKMAIFHFTAPCLHPLT
jgi:hypothetical protein